MSVKVAVYFGTHINILEVITPWYTPIQVNITIRMNSHGKQFQASIVMKDLQGLNIPIGLSLWYQNN